MMNYHRTFYLCYYKIGTLNIFQSDPPRCFFRLILDARFILLSVEHISKAIPVNTEGIAFI